MFDDVRDLYSDAILSHARQTRHAARPPAFDVQARGDNPMCGDRVTVFVRRGPGGELAQAGFEARGCELTRASADLMCEVVAGLPDPEARRVAALVARMAATGDCPACEPRLDALKPLSAVHEFPSRMRCVTLPWSALVAALDGKEVGDE